MNNPRLEIFLEVISSEKIIIGYTASATQSVSGPRYSLDLYDDSPFEIDYAIADVQDISSSGSAASKPFTIPLTANNLKALSWTNDMAADVNNNQAFNVNNLNIGQVVVDSILTFQGYFQVQNYIYDNLGKKTDATCVIIASNGTFYAKMGEHYLTDIDFSGYSHTYSLTSITASWYNNWESGYFYPLLDYGNNWVYTGINNTPITAWAVNGEFGNPYSLIQCGTNSIPVNQLYPSTYVRTIWDAIFNYNGFSYQSDFINSDFFNNLIIPFCNQNLAATQSIDKQFNVGSGFATSNDIDSLIYPNFDTSKDSEQFYQWNYFQFDNIEPPYGDPNNLIDLEEVVVTYYDYPYDYGTTSTLAMTYRNNLSDDLFDQSFSLTFSFVFTTTTEGSNPFNLYIQFFRQIDQTTGEQSYYWDNPYLNGGDQQQTQPGDQSNAQAGYFLFSNQPTQINPTTDNSVFSVNNVFNVDTLGVTGSITITTPILSNQNLWYNRLATGEGLRVVFFYKTGGFSQNVYITGGEFWNNVSLQINTGEYLNYDLAIPNNIKQNDFILSIVRLFNLFIEPSPIFPGTLIIEPYPNWYLNTQILDWNSPGKLDLTQPITKNILSNTQPRETMFSYSEDGDYWNTQYSAATNQIYGQWIFQNNNFFSSDTSTINLKFSPSPLTILPGSTNIRFTAIEQQSNPPAATNPGNQQNAVNSNIRILQRYPGLLPFDNNTDQIAFCEDNSTFGNPRDYIITDGDYNIPTSQTIPVYVYNSYPYAGHFDNPFNPTYDINFGQCPDYFVPTTNTEPSGTGSVFENILTATNSYNLYWNQMMQSITDPDARLVECSMYLTPLDIYNFSFRSIIYLQIEGNSQYYVVNAIKGYDPTQIKTCQVELLLLKNLTVPVQYPSQVKKGIGPGGVGIGVSVAIGIGGLPILTPNPLDPTSKNNGSNNIISGPYLNVNGNNSIVIGRAIQSNGVNNYILGNNLNIDGSGNNIQDVMSGNISGDDNSISNTYQLDVLGAQNTVKGSDGINISPSAFVTIVGLSNSVIGSSSNVELTGYNISIASQTSNIQVFGQNNVIESGVSNVTLVGQGAIVTPLQSGQTITVGSTVVYINAVNGLVDEVSDAFPEYSNTNLVTAGTDDILDFGTNTLVNFISAGVDEVL